MLSLDAKWMLNRSIDKARGEHHELLIFSFDRSLKANEEGAALEVLCSLNSNPEVMMQLCQEALSVVAGGLPTQAN